MNKEPIWKRRLREYKEAKNRSPRSICPELKALAERAANNERTEKSAEAYIDHRWHKCKHCKKRINPSADGDNAEVKVGRRYAHKDCQELAEWRKSSEHAKASRRGGKAGRASNGRIIRSPRGLS